MPIKVLPLPNIVMWVDIGSAGHAKIPPLAQDCSAVLLWVDICSCACAKVALLPEDVLFHFCGLP